MQSQCCPLGLRKFKRKFFNGGQRCHGENVVVAFPRNNSFSPNVGHQPPSVSEVGWTGWLATFLLCFFFERRLLEPLREIASEGFGQTVRPLHNIQ